MAPVARPCGAASLPREFQRTTSCGLAERSRAEEFRNWPMCLAPLNSPRCRAAPHLRQLRTCVNSQARFT